MKKKAVLCMLAAAVSGAVFLTEPQPAGRAVAADEVQVDAGVPAVEGWGGETYGDVQYAVWENHLDADQKLCLEWSLKSDFTLDKEYLTLDGSVGEYCLSKHFQEGHTYYVRAYIVETVKVSDRQGGWNEEKRYGPYSRTIIMEEKAPEADAVDFTAEADRVTMRLESAAPASGFEIQRAQGAGRYKRIAKTSDNVYIDIEVEEGTTYRYRIRTFVFEPKTRLTTYGPWKCLRAVTWGREMQVKAMPAGSKSVKVSWNRVPGATGYRVYRVAGIHKTETVLKGKKSSYRKLKLLASFQGSKVRSYQDTKVKAGEAYTYVVTACREMASRKGAAKTYVLQGMDSVSLDFGRMEIVRRRRRPDGSVRVTWKKKAGAEGYLIKKRNPATGFYEKYLRLSAKTGAHTFLGAAPGTTDQYQIYAYRGNVFSDGAEVSTSGEPVGKTENIQAYSTVDGQGVQLSWSRVEGAAYYKIYRSRMLSAYDGDRDSYDFRGEETVKVANRAGTGATDEIYATYAVDRRLELPGAAGRERVLVNPGPEQGLVYYYYVQAFRADRSKAVGASLFGKPARVLLNMPFSKPVLYFAKSLGGGKASVKWSPVEGAKKYYVYRSDTKKGEYLLAGKTVKNGFTDKNLQPGKKYFYKVKAYRPNAVGADLYSEASQVQGVTAW